MRANPRYKLTTKQLPGSMQIKADSQPVLAMVTDVAKGGLGLVMAREIPIGTDLIYSISGLTLTLRVVWSKRQKRNVRHGLKLLNADVDLQELYFALGLVDVDLDRFRDGVVDFD